MNPVSSSRPRLARAQKRRPASAPLLAGLLFALVPLRAAARPAGGDGSVLAGPLATIREEDISAHLLHLAAPELEGRDSPSAGLSRAAEYVAACFAEAGLRGAGADGSLRIPFTRELPAPLAARCALSWEVKGEEPVALVLGRDFVPLPGCEGGADGQPVFVGYGISARKERYDDLKGVKLAGKVAVLLEGEPRNARLFDGPDQLTPWADLYGKLEELAHAGAVGALLVRHPPAPADGLLPPALAYRYTWATWNPAVTDPVPVHRRTLSIPVHEVTAEAASAALGQDVLELARRIDERGRPVHLEPKERWISLQAATEPTAVAIDNVVGVLPGSDPELAAEYVVIGAHYDHIGVDPLGRIGYGADDNASGTSLLIELVQALAAAHPRRSILACAFAAEEDGLIGSRELCKALPVPREEIVAMLNFDMVGRGDLHEVVVLGTEQNPSLADVLERARGLAQSGVDEVTTGVAAQLWNRSDQYSFHQLGIPALFFFEAPREEDNADYHTFRDTIAALSLDKIANTTRFALQTTWILADDDDRPPPPRR